MDIAFILSAAEAVVEERSKVPFFVCGGIWAGFAVMISVFGFKRPDFPATAAAARRVMSIGALMFAMALSSAVYVAL